MLPASARVTFEAEENVSIRQEDSARCFPRGAKCRNQHFPGLPLRPALRCNLYQGVTNIASSMAILVIDFVPPSLE